MTSTLPNFNYRLALNEELKLRSARNPRYSLRSFARDLGVSTTALSDVLSAKRRFSKKNALKVIDRLGWSPLQSQSFLRDIAKAELFPQQSREEVLLQDDRFRLISDWYYLVILNLAKLPDSKSSPRWVAARIGISVSEAEQALHSLERLGYITTKTGRLKRLIPAVQTTTEISSAAIRKYHRQNFVLAANAQDHIPFAQRQISSFTVATDAKRVQKAKKLMNEFIDKLAAVLESPKPTEIYTLSTQLFPAKFILEESK